MIYERQPYFILSCTATENSFLPTSVLVRGEILRHDIASDIR